MKKPQTMSCVASLHHVLRAKCLRVDARDAERADALRREADLGVDAPWRGAALPE